MHCSFFFSLMGLCALEAVFVDKADKSKKGHVDNNVEKVDDHLKTGYLYQIFTQLQNTDNEVDYALVASKNKGCANTCLDKYMSNPAYQKHLPQGTDECNKCYSKDKDNNNVKHFKSCCQKAVDKAKKSIKSEGDSAKACMAKCDKPGADSSKKNKNSDTDSHEKPKNPENDDSKKTKN